MSNPSWWEDEPPWTDEEIEMLPDDWDWELRCEHWTDEQYADMLTDYERRVNEGRYE